MLNERKIFKILNHKKRKIFHGLLNVIINVCVNEIKKKNKNSTRKFYRINYIFSNH